MALASRLNRNVGVRGFASPRAAPSQIAKPRLSTVLNVSSSLDNFNSADLTSMDECPIFTDANGRIIQPMCADYGFRSGAGRLYMERYGETPGSVWDLAKQNFEKELEQLRQYTRFNYGVPESAREPTHLLSRATAAIGSAITGALGKLDLFLEESKLLPELKEPPKRSEFMSKEWEQIRTKLSQLKLDNAAVVAMEASRVKKEGELETPLLVKAPFLALCWVLDVLYEGRPIQKFWVLETVARIPYFAYISILHLYESLGFWRAGAELRRIHFAEEWNEMHHLQIMESLGGDMSWFDRFVAEHSAIAYYWLLVGFYLASPKIAYNFMQRVELHAMDTYAEFVEANRELLKTIPPPRVALEYYLNEDLYMFDQFQFQNASPRRPVCNNLLDVFTNIRDDELEHVKTMDACQKETIAKAIADNKK